jgi:hypothetical protein
MVEQRSLVTLACALTFRIVESLISVRIADTVDHQKATPVLTVPVAR